MSLLLAFAALLALALFSARYAWWRPAVDYRIPRILMYHMISEAQPQHRFRGLRVAPALFERQLAWLKANGWHFVTVSGLFEAAELPAKTVAITFDDGYADNCTAALPLLKKYGAKATLYLVVDRHGRDWSVSKKSHHDSGELMQEPKLSDEQVRELLGSGLIELGAHTLTHPKLTALDIEAKRAEIIGGKQQLEQSFGNKVQSFAYPFGIYDEQDVAIVREAGFSSAVTVVEGIDTNLAARALELKRVKVSGKEGMLGFKLRIKTGVRSWRS